MTSQPDAVVYVRHSIRSILAGGPATGPVGVQAWVRTVRTSKAGLAFVELNDGSSLANLQVVAESTLPNFDEVARLKTGAAVAVRGTAVESPATGQAIEVRADSLVLVGDSSDDFPLQKKRHSFEYLRTISHLRPRTNTFGAVARVRNEISRAIHDYFQEREYLWVHTPLITSIDAEGAGQMFQVTTIDLADVPRTERGVDFKLDLFERQAYLAVSGQLEAEIMATAFGNVYSFGPTFRAENSNTSRHLSEFWMVEPEIAWCDLKRLQDIAEEFIKHIFRAVLEDCGPDMAFFEERIEPGVIDKLRRVVECEFARITYTEAVDILEKSDQSFEFPVSWGVDLQSEHERYLTESTFKRPVIVTDYPLGIKAFYMRRNADGKTVAAMDVLAPRIGEIIGGSQREERYDELLAGMKAHGIDEKQYWWYLDLRRYGTVPHAGFGLGLERVVQFVTGMANIRDVIPFPRAPGLLEF